MSEPDRPVIKVETCEPRLPIGERNYCAVCGYPILWDEVWGWISGSHPDPEMGTYWAPPKFDCPLAVPDDGDFCEHGTYYEMPCPKCAQQRGLIDGGGSGE